MTDAPISAPGAGIGRSLRVGLIVRAVAHKLVPVLAVVAALIDWIEAELPPDCHVALVSSERAAPLYARAGFRPCRGMDRYADPAAASPP